jgi:hypothetical protein
MTDTHDDSSQPERATAVAAGGNARLSSPRTDAGVEHDRMLQREKEQFSGMHFGVGFFGWLTATGLTVLLSALITGIAALFGAQQASGSAMSALGVGGAIALLVVLLIAYFAGGYVAGRMARFSGVKQGVAVWLWAILIAVVLGIIGAIAGAQTGVVNQLGSVAQLPFSGSQMTVGAIVSALAVLVVTLIGAILGGIAGMRYHRRVDRAGKA